MYDSPHFNGILHDSARECVRLARMSDDPEVRVELFQLAREWMALAIQERNRAREPMHDRSTDGRLSAEADQRAAPGFG